MTTQKPLIMGILNVTPDSFHDGGEYNTIEKAVERAKQMELEGADIIDIGGESTGPGSVDISEEEEIRRTIEVIEAISKSVSIPISIDTYKSSVARKAIEAGATIINDITGLRGDPQIANVAAQYNTDLILMYGKDPTARTTIAEKQYEDVIETIITFFHSQIAQAKSADVDTSKIIIDPGMGHFLSSDPKYSFEVIAKIQQLKKLGHTVLIGPSRKSFMGGNKEGRLHKNTAINALCFYEGADIVRTHDVKECFDAREMAVRVLGVRNE